MNTGSTGVYSWNYNITGTSITGIISGDFDGDGTDDFALKASDSIYVVNCASQGAMFSVSLSSGSLRGFYAEDLIGVGGADELVTNVVDVGVTGYNSTGGIVWQGGAPLIYNVYSTESDCAFGDVDGDGFTDVIFTNYEYVSVLSGQTQRMLWHHVHDGPIYGPVVGKLDGSSTPLDILAHSGSEFFVISGSQVPPLWLPPTVAPPAASPSFMEVLIVSSDVGIPLCSVLVIGAVVSRRKLELTK